LIPISITDIDQFFVIIFSEFDFLQMTRIDFLDLLKRRRVAYLNYTEEELEEELSSGLLVQSTFDALLLGIGK